MDKSRITSPRKQVAEVQTLIPMSTRKRSSKEVSNKDVSIPVTPVTRKRASTEVDNTLTKLESDGHIKDVVIEATPVVSKRTSKVVKNISSIITSDDGAGTRNAQTPALIRKRLSKDAVLGATEEKGIGLQKLGKKDSKQTTIERKIWHVNA